MSIHKNPTGTFTVRWRDANQQQHQKTFASKAEAKKFEAYLLLTPESKADVTKVITAMELYRDTVTVTKPGCRAETLRLQRLMTRPFAQKTFGELKAQDFEDYFEARLKEQTARSGKGLVSPSTVHKERSLLNSVIEFAIRKGMATKNPLKGVPQLKLPPHRERIATEEDIQKIMLAAAWDGNSVPETMTQLVAAAFVFSCRTGMRAGEILAIEECWIDGRVIHLPKEATKTNSRRDVALSSEAYRILELVSQRGTRPIIFGDLTAQIRDVLWRKIRNRAGLSAVYDSRGREIREGLNFHDARATFATWAASPDPKTGAPRLDVLALARQTGHKDLKMLQRYYRAPAEKIAAMLDDATLTDTPV